MSYTKTVWTDGDVISTARLNKIETGIEEAYSSGTSEPDFVLTAIGYESEDSESEPEYELICTGISYNEIVDKIINSSLNAIMRFKGMGLNGSGDYQLVEANLSQLGLSYRKDFNDNSEYDEYIMGYDNHGGPLFHMNESQIMVHFNTNLVYDYTYDSTTKTYTLTEATDEQGQ